MITSIRIGLIGDFDTAVTAHRAIPRALALASDALGVSVTPEWVPTEEIVAPSCVEGFDGLWCVPASPYRSMDGALYAIRFAREQGRPFLGTCGGFQHAVVEYARNVLGWADAEHAETAPEAARPVVTLLECALVEAADTLRFREGSRIAAAYGGLEATERYRCRYGLNPAFRETLVSGPMRVSAEDAAGEVRAIELDNAHPFFVATLFQPERAALEGRLPPIVAAFVRSMAAIKAGTAAAGYDPVADEYALKFFHELDHKPFDRELLDQFARRLHGKGPVCDLGCGPGQIARYLSDRGADAFGIDLSPTMIEAAQRLNPGLRFSQGDLRTLDAEDETWAGIAAFYSLIHVPHDEMVAALRELNRVLQPGGLLLLSFHIGSQVVHRDELLGKPVSLDFHFFTLDEMHGYLGEAGFDVEQVLERAPYEDVEYPSQRGYILARKPCHS